MQWKDETTVIAFNLFMLGDCADKGGQDLKYLCKKTEINPSNAEATFIQSTRTQRFSKTI